MWPNPQEIADWNTSTEEILNWKFYFLCSPNQISWLNGVFTARTVSFGIKL